MSKYELLKKLELIILCVLAGVLLLQNYTFYMPEAFSYQLFVVLLWGGALLSLVKPRIGAWAVLLLVAINLLTILISSLIDIPRDHPGTAKTCLWTCYALRLALHFMPNIFVAAILMLQCRGLLKELTPTGFFYHRHVALWILSVWLLGGYMQVPLRYTSCILQFNGTWQGGWEGRCLITYADGGKVCSNKSDCQSGACIIKGQNVDQDATNLSGQCIKKNIPDWGCLTFIDKGKVVFWTCLDG